MSLHHIANHLAAKGRHGDSTLVHMTKGEVAGLQALAKKNGTTLTINPQTGLPEAFSLKSLIPLAAGLMLGPAGFGLTSAMGAGLMVGGATALGTGSLKQGLMAGLGAYGGAGLGGAAGAGASGSITGPATTAPVVGGEVVATPITTTVPGMEQATTAFTPSQPMPSTMPNTSGAGWTAQPEYVAPQGSSVNGLTNTNVEAVGPVQSAPTSATTATGGTTYGASPQPSTFDKITANAEANPKLLAYGMAPAISEELTPKPYQPEKANVDSDMGQRLAYNSGYSNDIPGRTGPASYSQISDTDAKKLYGFADGGAIQYPTGESVMRMAEGGAASPVGYGGNVGDYGPANANIAAYGLGNGINYSGYDTAPNQGIAAIAPQGNPNQNIVDLYKAVDDKRIAEEAEAKRVAEAASAVDYSGGSSVGGPSYYEGAAQGGLMQSYAQGGEVQSYGGGGISFSGDPSTGSGPFAELFRKIKAAQGGASEGDSGVAAYTYDPNSQQYTPKMAGGGGISTLGGYSDGGRLLKGPGDGMSDNIPAKIGSKQPARLADGEFVVPADVVSHLGNGSTDAGAKQLYKMMDKIRTARTGRKAQGKQINPNKFMPA
jgi:hypothetical protein